MNEEQFETLIRVDCNVKALMEQRKEQVKKDEALDKRVTSLEHSKHRQAGAMAALSVAVSTAWHWWLNK